MRLLVLHDKPRGEMGGMNTFIAAQNAMFERAGWSVSELLSTPTVPAGTLHLKPSGRRSGLLAALICAQLSPMSAPMQ